MTNLPVIPVKKVALLLAASLRMKARDVKELMLHELRKLGYTGPADAAALHGVLARAAVAAAREEPFADELASELAALRCAVLIGQSDHETDADGTLKPLRLLVLPWDSATPDNVPVLGVYDDDGLKELHENLAAEAKREGWRLLVM